MLPRIGISCTTKELFDFVVLCYLPLVNCHFQSTINMF